MWITALYILKNAEASRFQNIGKHIDNPAFEDDLHREIDIEVDEVWVSTLHVYDENGKLDQHIMI